MKRFEDFLQKYEIMARKIDKCSWPWDDVQAIARANQEKGGLDRR